MALSRPPTPQDLDPIALGVLLLGVIARKRATGTLTLRHDGQEHAFVLSEGISYSTEQERIGLKICMAWPECTYSFDPSATAAGERHKAGLVGIVAQVVRNQMRALSAGDIISGFLDCAELRPMVKEESVDMIDRLRLTQAETQVLNFGFDQSLALQDIAAGPGSLAALQLVLLLSAFDVLEWRPPGGAG
jgi:hypothetical protein